MLSKVRIGFRLTALTALMLVVAAALTWVGLRGIAVVGGELKTVYEDRTVALGYLAEVQNALQRLRVRAINTVLAETDDERRRQLADIRQFDARINERWREYSLTYLTPEEKRLADSYAALLGDYRRVRTQVVDAATSGARENAFKLMRGEANDKFRAAEAVMEELMALQVRGAAEEYAAATKSAAFSRSLALTLGVLGLLVGVGLAVLIVRSITVSLRSTVETMGRLADNDLTVTVAGQDRRDEVGNICRAVQVFKDNAIAMRQLDLLTMAVETPEVTTEGTASSDADDGSAYATAGDQVRHVPLPGVCAAVVHSWPSRASPLRPHPPAWNGGDGGVARHCRHGFGARRSLAARRACDEGYGRVPRPTRLFVIMPSLPSIWDLYSIEAVGEGTTIHEFLSLARRNK